MKKNNLQTCKEAIKLINEWIAIEWENTTEKEEWQTRLAFALYTARDVFTDLQARYEKEDYGKTIGIEKVLEILKQKGYDSIRAEIESELKADGEI